MACLPPPRQVRYMLEYADFLASLTEDHNTRALFEKASRPAGRPPPHNKTAT